MNLLITGADRPLGQLASAHFGSTATLRLTGQGSLPAGSDPAWPYHSADLRTPAEVAPLVAGVDAILHLDVYDPAPISGPQAEQDRLDLAARGTYVLLDEARKVGVERLVLASTLALLAAYPADYVLDETWQPEPEPQAESLAPYLSEITCREFAREGGIQTICLRFGPLGQPGGTTEADALGALAAALAMPFKENGYRWHLFHIATNNDRFPLRAALQTLGFGQKGDD